MDWLVKTIEAEIIPRLMAAHQADPLRYAGPCPESIQHDEVADFAEISLTRDADQCAGYVDSLRQRGVSLDAIYLDLIAPAARRLGELWTADLCSFTDVTVGLWRMQKVMYDLSPSFHASATHNGISEQHHAMLMAMPGSQHTMGILMVGEFFMQAGWKVWSEPGAERERLLEAVSEEWFDVAGISVGSEPQLRGLRPLIEELRQCSRNSAIAIMVGGPMFLNDPDAAIEYGADAVSLDAREAVRQAESMVALREEKDAAYKKKRIIG